MIAGRELLEEYRNRLSDEEWALADLRAQGCDWAEIASQLGGTPQARCKQLARAMNVRRNSHPGLIDSQEAKAGHP